MEVFSTYFHTIVVDDLEHGDDGDHKHGDVDDADDDNASSWEKVTNGSVFNMFSHAHRKETWPIPN